MTILPRDLSPQQVLASILSRKGVVMERRNHSKGKIGWVLGLLVMGAALMLFACDPVPSGQSDLAKKPPPNLGAIADVDGATEEKPDAKKPQAGAEQKPAQSPAESQPAQAAPKQ